MHEENGYSYNYLQEEDWGEICSGGEFARKYEIACKRTIGTKRSLKGARWGRTLGRYIAKNPCKNGTDQLRPIVWQAQIIADMRSYDYDLHRKAQYFDESTLEARYRRPLEQI
jgi:hypothetical protein